MDSQRTYCCLNVQLTQTDFMQIGSESREGGKTRQETIDFLHGLETRAVLEQVQLVTFECMRSLLCGRFSNESVKLEMTHVDEMCPRFRSIFQKTRQGFIKHLCRN